ncbi:MAG TPA: FAD-dependent 5-carboxymethylaminomethyl-2-thiouridine(34) oxidoreductase MnmC, partial [Pusillimonas sp.]|uniref:FAD-dependent 5-carboxymethylaminomethyl-2-thiouridine(34) oxidoreductase MnmC n=1 Tax=Pusillimonas sp. TaxID=3040095 RepID=UPI002BB43E6A
VTLTLIFGRIEHTAREGQAGVDAFFLDGFSPTKNPEMWSPALFGQLVRIARPGATAATWCANGAVRRDLRDAGFLVRKTPGLGGKWAMTQAVLRPGLGRGTTAQEAGPILVVGAGPAGAGMAHALALRGCEVLVADPSLSAGRGASHRGHLAAAITPLVSRDDDQRARLSRAGVLRALNRWQDLPQPARPRRTGTVELMRDADHERERQLTLATLQFPQEWVSWLEPAELSGRVGFTLDRPGICFADGQLVQPEPLLDALLDHPRIECRGVRIEQLQADGDAWLARSSDGQLIAAATVVLANAGEAAKLLSTCMDLSQLPKLKAGWRVAGQVSYLRADLARHDPATVVSAEGYWLPQVQGLNVAGSTYVLDAASTQVTAPGHRAIAQQVAQTLGVTPEQVQSWLGRPDGWAGWRAVVAGRLPVFGPVPKAPGLWLACAYGSRGLSWAALAGDLLGASLRGEPQPLERSLQKAVAPR